MTRPPSSYTRGFSLVEVALALGVAAFCLAAVFSLLPLGFTSNQQSSEETAAVNLLSNVASDLKAAKLPVGMSEAVKTRQFNISIPVSGSGSSTLYFSDTGLQGASATKDSRYRLELTFLAHPSGTGDDSALMARLKVTWPAAAANPVNKVETFVALDRQ